MKPSELRNLQPGDRIWWEDPDEGIGSRFYTVRRAGTKGLSATIECMDGTVLRCPVQQIVRESDAPRK